MPATRPEFWHSKIAANCARDARDLTALAERGFRVLTVWECCIKGPSRRPLDQVLTRCSAFILGRAKRGTLAGSPRTP